MVKKTKVKSRVKTKKKINKKKIFLTCLAVIFVVAAVLTALFSSRSGSSDLIKLNKNVAYGIDVSYHNGKIDWKKVKGEVDFAFIRVGYRGYDDGMVHLDSKAKDNLKNANKNDLPIGVYFYSQAINDSEAEEEADFLLEKIKGYDISLPVVIDFEYPYSNGKQVGRLSNANLTRKEKTSLINAFCQKVENAGYTPCVYASSYIYRSHINVNKLDKDIMIWVADYNEKVRYGGEYDFWQFSEKGKCNGVSSKYVDTNYWYIKNENNN